MATADLSPDFSLDRIAKARWAILAAFLLNGIVLASWAQMIPVVKEQLALSDAALGGALLFMAFGALVAMPVAGAVMTRIGTAWIVRLSAVAFALGLVLPALAPTYAILALSLILFGAANGAMDVSMNAHGLSVETRLDKAVMSSFHGGYSVGALIGAAAAGTLLDLVLPIWMVIIVIVTALSLLLYAAPRLLPASADAGSDAPIVALPSRRVVGIGILSFIALMGEGAIVEWSAVLLRGDMAAKASTAGLALAGFAAAMAIGRFTGDRMRLRFGFSRLLIVSGLIASIGMAGGLLGGTAWSVIAGFTLAGFGYANMVPVLFGVAGRIVGESPSRSIAAVATVGYFGLLAGPPIIGFIADVTGLTNALLMVAALVSLLALLGARLLQNT